MKITIDLPETQNISEVGEAYLKEALASTLYHAGKISEKEACAMTGKSRREFEEILPKFGFSVLSDKPENIEMELTA